MSRDKVMRCSLAASVVFNLFGALVFGFPSSPLGQFAGLPNAVPGIYRALVALFVLLFGCAYAWLACQRNIDWPLVALGAIGKAGAFSLVLIFWLAGEAPTRGVAAATGDLILAAIFAWWLLASRNVTANGRPDSREATR